MSEAGGDTSVDTQQTQDGEQGADPMAALNERMEGFSTEFRDGLGELKEAILAQQQPDLEGYDEDDTGLYDPFGEELDDGLYEDDIDPREAQEAQRKLQQIIQQQTQQAVGPLQEQLEQMRVRSEANDIAQKYPDLDNPKIAQATIEAASRHAARLGMPELAGEPAFLEMTYLAGRAEEQAAQETPAGGHDGIRLEGAGGVTPDLQQAADEYGDRIVNAGRSNLYG